MKSLLLRTLPTAPLVVKELSASTIEKRAKILEFSSASSDLIEEDSVISENQNWDLSKVSIANHSVVTAPAATR